MTGRRSQNSIRELLDVYLVKQGFHCGEFQSIESVWLSDNDKSALDQVCPPKSWEHKHACRTITLP